MNYKMFYLAIKLKRRLIPLLSIVIYLLLTGCAQNLPTFAHVHVGHSLSAWTNTPGKVGLFKLSEKFGEKITRSAITLNDEAINDDVPAVKRNAAEILNLMGSVDDQIDKPKAYRFLTAFKGAYDHLAYSQASSDATQNMSEGLMVLLTNAESIFIRSELIKSLADALQYETDQDSILEISKELRKLAVDNYEGSDSEYGLRQMRDELFEVLDRENPPYTAPERRYLFGVIRLPDGTWFWKFKSSASGGGSYGSGSGGGY